MTIEYKDSKRITGLAIDKTGYNDIQGYAGGAKSGSAQYGAGGGGGAGAVGNPDTSSGSGAGGIGVVNPITGSTVGQLDSGTTYYLAGGGGGGAHSSGQGTVGAGGKGGGHAGNTGSSIPSGTANTGGGAGGDSAGADSYTGGGIGGSGVVILSYKTSSITDNSTGGSLETGGNIPSGYAIRKFTATGNSSFIITGSGDVQYVVVAGGGGSGSQVGGGGGAGGYRTGTTTLSAGTYTVTVGAGGVACNTSSSIRAGNGADSVFNNITSTGGGGGADNDISPYTNGRAGGSGGGGTYRSGATGAGAGTTTVTDIHIKIPTNVQDNSIFVEKDTARRYWFSEEVSGSDTNTTQTNEGDNSGIGGANGGWGARFNAGHPLVGHEIRSIIVKMKIGSGSPNTVDMTARVYGSTKATLRATSTAVSSSSVTTSYQSFTFVFPSGSRGVIQAGDHIMIVSDSAITSGDFSTPIKSSAGTNTHFTTWQGQTNAFTEQTTRELYYNPIVSGTFTAATWTWENLISGFAGTWGKDPSDSQFEVSGGRLNFLDDENSTGDRTWLDLGTDVSTTKWLLRFKFNFSTLASGTYYYEFDAGLSDTTVKNNVNQNFIGVRCLPASNANLWRPRTCDGSSSPRTGSTANITQSFSTGTDYFVEIKRTSASNWSISLSTTNAYDGDIQDNSYTDASGSTGLRYFKFGDAVDNTTAGADMQGVCDVLEFYNGVTTPV